MPSDQDRSAPDGDHEPDEEQSRDRHEESSLPFDGRLPSWAFLIFAVLAVAFLVVLLMAPLNS